MECLIFQLNRGLVLQITRFGNLKIIVLRNLTIRASLAPRDALFFYTIFTQGKEQATVLQALCKS